MKRHLSCTIFLFTLIICLSSSCTRETERQQKVALVNGAPVFLKDYREEVALISRNNPAFKVNATSLEEQLNTMIDKKLMIQEAMKLGLSDDERFIKTIKRFWEQTLIRELIGAKNKEWSDILFATDDEVRGHYERMGSRTTFNIATTESEEEAKALLSDMVNKKHQGATETIGPLMVDDVQMESHLYSAFTLSTGETRIYQDKKGYTVIQVVKRERSQLPPLSEVYEQIREGLIEEKQQRLLGQWLREVRESSEITVNSSILREVAREQ
ncbi:MAG: hypothetical protein ACE5D4_10280 [Thermodesulfobacteriota bacterium]